MHHQFENDTCKIAFKIPTSIINTSIGFGDYTDLLRWKNQQLVLPIDH